MTAFRLLLGVVALSVSSAACDTSRPADAVSAAARAALESKVLAIMDASGLPVQDDNIGCIADRDGRTVSCYGLTSDEPVEEIQGTFKAFAGAGGQSGTGCPGTLSVTVGPPAADITTNSPVQRLATTGEDPCR